MLTVNSNDSIAEQNVDFLHALGPIGLCNKYWSAVSCKVKVLSGWCANSHSN